jgi:hypothetical protein
LALTEQLAEANTVISTKLHITVTPEQVDAAATAIATRIYISELPGLSTALARAAARAFGLSMAEDGQG